MTQNKEWHGSELAIVGMAGRFPGAKNVEEFWRNLREGVDAVQLLSDEELRAAGVDSALLKNPSYVKAAMILDGVDLFDASFFGYTPREAEIMDPQHRLFLECARDALEDSACDPETYQGLIGVFAGSGFPTYFTDNVLTNRKVMELMGLLQAAVGNERDSLASTVSYKLNLKGPSLAIQTFCSTSLVAVHLACQSLLNYECDMALAGGVAIGLPQGVGYLYQAGGIASPDGHCRTFDEKAQGSIYGSGVGTVVLKRLDDALADRNIIHAVIKGSATNNDGALKVGYTAPGLDGQSAVIAEAMANAGVDAETISYIETHGTATPLGDSIELAAIMKAFQGKTQRKQFCAIGSVKPNIGHLDRAAGVANLIKASLALKHQEMPASLHFERPNPDINFEDSPFYVNTKLTAWNRSESPRRAGVSSFGLGGTNAHVVLEEAPAAQPSGDSRPYQLIAISAKTPSALDTATANLAARLKNDPGLNLADAAYTLHVGRTAFNHRRILVSKDTQDATRALETFDPRCVFTVNQEKRKRSVTFMLSGVGDHYEGMARGLYQNEKVFKDEVDRCCELLTPMLGTDLRKLIFTDDGQEKTDTGSTQGLNLRQMLARSEQANGSVSTLHQTRLAQPAVFVIEYALAQLLQHWGIKPQQLIGYSLGEYVAACLAGVFSLEDGLKVVAKRAALIEEVSQGAMLAVSLSETELEPLLGEETSISIINGERMCVVGGPVSAIEALEQRLIAPEIASRRLPTAHAFHTRMMEEVSERFSELLATVKLNAPQIPVVSNVTGKLLTEAEATDAQYWVRHMCRTVRFADGVAEILKEESAVIVEVGCGQSLSSFVKQHGKYAESQDRVVISTIPHEWDRVSDEEVLSTAIGKLWLSGVEIDWERYYDGQERYRVQLPTYPFERQRYWIEAGDRTPTVNEIKCSSGKKADVAEWFYQPVWTEAALPAPTAGQEDSGWLIFADECGVGVQLAESLKEQSRSVITVKAGEKFERLGDGAFTINPASEADYSALIREIKETGDVPGRVAHLWNLTATRELSFEEAQHLGFYSQLFLAKALGVQQVTQAIRLDMISNHVQSVSETDQLCPEKSTLLGPCKVMPQEYPNVTCRSIDVWLDQPDNAEEQKRVAEQLENELSVESTDLVVAYRNTQRYVQTYEPQRVEAVSAGAEGLKEEGVYLITGGLGGVGLVLAKSLARTWRAKLVLTGRRGLPEREQWSEWLASHDESDGTSRKIRKVQALEELGAQVLVLSADVANEEDMRHVLARTKERFGQLNGVIYAAGISDEKAFAVIQQITRVECDWHFQPKVHGLITLEKVLRDYELDFCFLFSSLSSVLGGILFSAYTSANIFIDAFARKLNQTSRTRWITVNWDSWNVKEQELQDARYKRLESTLADFAMTPDEGVEAFRRVLAADSLTHLVHSTADLETRLDQWIRRTDLRGKKTAQSDSGTLYARPSLQNAYIAVSNEEERRIAGVFQRVLGIEKVGLHDNYFDLGGNSLLAIQVIAELQKEFNTQVSPIALFEAPTVHDLAGLICPEKRGADKKDSLQQAVERRRRVREQGDGGAVAIVGMAGRFPGANSTSEFWENLRDGIESVSFFSDKELIESGIDPVLLRNPAYIKARPILDNIDEFDASFFGYSPREAELIDPQHRLFIESAWEALESAGYDSLKYNGSIGVFAGSNMSHYLLNLYADPNIAPDLNDFEAGLGNERDSLTTRISYKLNLTGPSFAVQTFCSTSLVAVHLACQSILNGECDMALAGGVALKLPTKIGYLYQAGDQVSADGHTRAFDSRAKGTVFGDGVATVVLKRLEDAVADGDTIHAVIKGSAINNDGSLKVGYTAPSVEGQAEVVAVALAQAGVDPSSISYIEAHGTATELGDPIELAALTKAFRLSTGEKTYCAIGSVKTNVGHLDRAAGVTGLIKTVQALKHELLPPSLHYESPNPNIDFDNSPFYVNTELTPWKRNGHPRRAGVNSLGVGGTNVHVVLEEAPVQSESSESREWQLLRLSAKSESALEQMTANLCEYLKQASEDEKLADIAYTLQVGRRSFNHRRMLVCSNREDAISALESHDARRVLSYYEEPKSRPITFMMSGVGDHYEGMARGLYQSEKIFKEEVDRCCELLRPLIGTDLRKLIFAESKKSETNSSGATQNLRQMLARAENTNSASSELHQTRLAQPAVFVIEYALAQQLQHWGIRPQQLIGYSLGEYVAACLSGVFSLEDAVKVVARRAALIEEVGQGAMLAVSLSEAELKPLLGEGLSISIINGERMCIVGGTVTAIEELEQRLTAQEIASRRLPTEHAFHTPMMQEVGARYADVLSTVKLNAPQIPMLSNVTGQLLTEAEAIDPQYWIRHMCETVRFADGIAQILKDETGVVVEVGCGQSLSSFVKQHGKFAESQERVVISTLRHEWERASDEEILSTALGKLWLSGIEFEWERYYEDENRRRVQLPTYPFERQRYWIETSRKGLNVGAFKSKGKKDDIADWFYQPVWRESPLVNQKKATSGDETKWMIFLDEFGVGDQLARQLKDAGEQVVSVQIGEQFSQISTDAYTLRPGDASDYDSLFKAVQTRVPTRIIHLWSITEEEDAEPGIERFEKLQDLGYYSLVFLAKAFGKQFISDPLELVVISNGLQNVTGEETLTPEKATLLGPCKSIPQEYTNINVRSIDILKDEWQAPQSERQIKQFIADVRSDSPDLLTAYRSGKRLAQTYEPLRVESVDDETTKLREGGVYLITGGLGGVGLILAKYLAEKLKAKLVLTGRAEFPERTEWTNWLESHDEDDSLSRKIRKVQALEELGAEVLIASADAADEAQMQLVIQQTEQRFGRLNGVIHAAGIPSGDGFRVIQELDRRDSEYQFQAKAYGLLVLKKVLADSDLDFCLLVSSLSSVLGGITMAAYSAVNIFMDAVAYHHNRTGSLKWLSVNWDTWQLRLGQHDVIGKTVAEFEMLPEEGANAFERLISRHPATQVVNSTGDLQARLDQWVSRKSLETTSGTAQSGGIKTYYSRPNLQTAYIPATSDAEERIAAIWQQVLGIEKVGIHDNYFELGGTSLSAIQVIAKLQKEFNVPVSPIALFEASTVFELAKRFTPQHQEGVEEPLVKAIKRRKKLKQAEERPDIAVISMSGRFPGAGSVKQFWKNVSEGVESVAALTDEELTSAGVRAETFSEPNYIKARPIIDDVELFDAGFFGYTPKEADFIDPQQRLFIECAWETLESAGYDTLRYDGAIGVFAGANISSYGLHLLSDPSLAAILHGIDWSVTNASDSLTTRVSYKLNLKGPSFLVNTFCSTSLVAVHLASQSLINGECDMALAGGVSIKVPQKTGYHFDDGGQESPDGHTRTFDCRAKGTVFGDGVGVVLLKRLDDALADGDNIQAVIKGSAINNDGSLKVSYTAPSVEGQAEVVAVALAQAGVDPASISYIEAHGTATELGDPIELAALTKAFRLSTDAAQYCAIGSVKTNVGHLDRAAGVTGLIKTVQALKHELLPPSLHYESPNPKIDFQHSPFYVNTELTPWKRNGKPRRAGVNSLGVGGTNVHVVLEEAPSQGASSESRELQLLLLSAKSATALEQMTENLCDHLKQSEEEKLADVAYTLQVGRRGFNHRRMLVCRNREDAISALESRDARRVLSYYQEPKSRPITFMLSGVGDHYEGMARGLYQSERVFKEEVDRCCDLLLPLLGTDLRQLIFRANNQPQSNNGSAPKLNLREMLARAEQSNSTPSELQQTRLAQPAVFVIEYALAQLLQHWGIRPQQLIGYSLGEYVAACLSGVFSLEDAVKVVALRAALIEEVGHGAMLAVSLSEAELQPLLGEGLSISIINGEKMCVVGGTIAAIEELEQSLTAQEIASRRLPTEHAFHTPMMQEVAARFADVLAEVNLNAPRIPMFSNVTGALLTAEEAIDPQYWVRHMCETVRFADGLSELLKEAAGIVIEVGCGQSLSSFVKQHGKYAESQERVVITTLRNEWERVSDEEVLSTALGKLWLSGVELDWERYYEEEQRHRAQLPTYPFERQRYWIEPRQLAGSNGSTLNHLDKNPSLSEWFYVPVWKQSVPLVQTESDVRESRVWLVMTDGSSLAAKVVKQLESSGDEVVCVTPGDRFNRTNDSNYTINPRQRDDYDQLFRELSDEARIPGRIVHLWNLAPCDREASHLESTEATMNLGFYALMFVTQALGDLGVDEMSIIIVSSEMQKVTGDERISSEKSTLLGPCRVIPQEFINITCRCVDVIPPVPESKQEEELSRRLFTELNRDSSDALIAYRGQQRWVQSFEQLRLPALTATTPRFKTGGTYLITGGVGGIGLAMAEHLARSAQANLILVGRSGLPKREQWTELLADENTPPSLAQKIAQVAAMEEMGSDVLVLSADVGDLEQMREVVRQGEEQCGRIDGVIHAAGVPGEGLIQLKTEEAAASVLRPKVQGTLVLEELFKDHSLDFLVLISSMNTVTGGGPGQLDYCAANAFLDGFAHANSDNGRHTVATNWGEWQWNAWEKGLEGFDPEIQAFFRENRRKIGISFLEGMDALERILTAGLSQAIVSTQNFHAVIEGSKSFTVQQILQEAAKSRDAGGPTHSRPVLGTAYVAPTNDIEQTIADIWQDILGIQQVGIQDNFFELGGHSLLATQLFSRLRRLYDVKLSLRSIFEMPTIADQAQMIEALRWTDTDPSLLLAPQGVPEEGMVEGEL